MKRKSYHSKVVKDYPVQLNQNKTQYSVIRETLKSLGKIA